MHIINLFLVRKRNRIKSNKIPLQFTAYEVELVIKCLATGYRHFENEKILFHNKKSDKENIYYLQRVLGCKANKYFYDIDNNAFLK